MLLKNYLMQLKICSKVENERRVYFDFDNISKNNLNFCYSKMNTEKKMRRRIESENVKCGYERCLNHCAIMKKRKC